MKNNDRNEEIPRLPPTTTISSKSNSANTSCTLIADHPLSWESDGQL